MENNKKLKIGLVVVLAIMLLAAMFNNNKTNEPKKKEATTINYEVSAADCYVISQAYIKLYLKSPKSADFPFSEYSHTQIDSVTHMIKSYVDSKNAYNATIRTHYTITMQFHGGSWADQSSWTVIDLKAE